MQSIRVERLVLSDMGPFPQLDIRFSAKAGMNLICGDNGIGKTTILEAIASAFTRGTQRIRKRAGSDVGIISINVLDDDIPKRHKASVAAFLPNDSNRFQIFPQLSRRVINVRATRDFEYTTRDSILRDPDASDEISARRVGAGLDSAEIKQWFSNRFLMAPHAEASGWTDAMRKNLESATGFFSVLDGNVKLHSVDVRTFDILVNTPGGVIPFEYLSSGFRSAYALLLGILKEIEFRAMAVAAEDFSGIILIDEIELHFHPEWQRKISGALTTAFPEAQIFASTHSPHVIQAARPSEVIALARQGDGKVYVRDLPSTEFGYGGWTVEEVLEYVMGMSDTRTPVFRQAMESFDKALFDNDPIETERFLKELKEMLHPANPLSKLIEIQASPVIGGRE